MKKTRPSRHIGRLVAGLMVLGAISGVSAATPHPASAPALVFRPVSVPDGPRATIGPPVAPVPSETHLRRPEPSMAVSRDLPQIAHSTAIPQPTFANVGHELRGRASWYCWPAYPSPCAKGYPYGGDYAAAGPKLRAAMCGSQASNCWRGRYVTVNGVSVRLIDWCQCFWHQPNEKVIDLYHNVFTETGSSVTIRWR